MISHYNMKYFGSLWQAACFRVLFKTSTSIDEAVRASTTLSPHLRFTLSLHRATTTSTGAVRMVSEQHWR